MSKAVFVIDMPGCCADCRLNEDDPAGLYCFLADEYFDGNDSSEEKPEWCPLRELPAQKEATSLLNPLLWEKQNTDYEKGWNDCLKELEDEDG